MEKHKFMFGCELKSCIKVNYTVDYFNSNHTHPYYELVYYYEGSGEVNVMDKRYPFSSGYFSMSNPEHYHNERGKKGTSLIYISFTLTGMTIEDGIYKDPDGTIGQLMKECYRELQERKTVFQLFLNNLAERIVLSIIRITQKPNSDKDNFSYILNYIDMGYNLNLSVKDIAKNIGYSYDYFRDLFYEHMGISVKEYLLTKKIEHAKSLLTTTKYSLTKVADLSGFSSASHLCLIFRTKLGVTPQEFVLNYKKEKSDYVADQTYIDTKDEK